MKIKDYKCKCGHNDFFFADKGSQKGIYCSYCGKWVKWADKDEQNLAMKQGLTYTSQIAQKAYEDGKKDGYVQAKLEQEQVLDKIKAKILEKCFNVPYKNQAFDYGLKIVKWSDVREILDKYKAESEDKE